MAYNKYGAIKVKLDGYVFDSKLEAARYKFLKELDNIDHLDFAGGTGRISGHLQHKCKKRYYNK